MLKRLTAATAIAVAALVALLTLASAATAAKGPRAARAPDATLGPVPLAVRNAVGKFNRRSVMLQPAITKALRAKASNRTGGTLAFHSLNPGAAYCTRRRHPDLPVEGEIFAWGASDPRHLIAVTQPILVRSESPTFSLYSTYSSE